MGDFGLLEPGATGLPLPVENGVTGAAVVVNLLAQAAIFAAYRRSRNAGRGNSGNNSNTTLQTAELSVYVITIASNAFFFARVIPVWTDLSCLVFHGLIMAIYEVQLLAYSYVQLHRFGKSQMSNSVLASATAALAVCSLVLSAASAATQKGYVISAQCHFIHDWRVALTSALFHLALDTTFLMLFRKNLANARRAKSVASAVVLHRIFFWATVILAIFGLWCVYLSIANLTITSLVLEVSYNFHFTFIGLAVLAPRIVKDIEKKNVRPDASKLGAPLFEIQIDQTTTVVQKTAPHGPDTPTISKASGVN